MVVFIFGMLSAFFGGVVILSDLWAMANGLNEQVLLFAFIRAAEAMEYGQIFAITQWVVPFASGIVLMIYGARPLPQIQLRKN